MNRNLLAPLIALLITSSLIASDPETGKMKEKETSKPSVTLGYVILYVEDVASTLEFYEEAFGLSQRFFADEEGKAYGELETGAARLAFASLKLANEHLNQEVITTSLSKPPLGFEVALVTSDVTSLFERAVKAGAVIVSEPETKPWGQTVAYLRDKDGHLVEICTPLP